MRRFDSEDRVRPVVFDDGYVYRDMELDDLDEIMDIERASFLSAWPPHAFVSEFFNEQSHRRCLISPDGHVAGYLLYWVILDESHIMNIAIEPEERQRGLALRMMEQALWEAEDRRCTLMSLEVRANNEAALALYFKLGFEAVGRRKNYYQEERQDAILMTGDLATMLERLSPRSDS